MISPDIKTGLRIVFSFASLLAGCGPQGNPNGTKADFTPQSPSQGTEASPSLPCTEKTLPDVATVDGQPFGIRWSPPVENEVDFTGVTNPNTTVPIQTVDSQGGTYVIELKPSGEITVQSTADMSVVEYITHKTLDPRFPLILQIGEGYYAFTAPCDIDSDGLPDPSEVSTGTLVPIPTYTHPEAGLFGEPMFAWNLAPTPTPIRPLKSDMV